MAVKLQLRRDSSTNWANTNPILSQGEPAFETDTGIVKVGDGTTAYNALRKTYSGFLDNYIVQTLTANTTLVLNDGGKLLSFTGSTPITVTLPAASTLPDGWKIKIYTRGAAALSVVRAGTDTIDGQTTAREVFRTAEIVKISATDFAFMG